MNVATMKMPVDEALAKLAEYRGGLAHKKNDVEYRAAVDAYEAAAEGKPLLVLSAVMEHAPRDHKGRPRLAIARADQKQVEYRRSRWGNTEQFSIFNAHQRMRDRSIDVIAAARTPAFNREANPDTNELRGYALIPIVPPLVRGRMDLGRRFILWEVETWSDTRLGAIPDRDPYLLERVSDDLFAVVGEWDLTEIERAIMRGRVRS